MYQGHIRSMPNCCTAGEVGSAQKVHTRRPDRSWRRTSSAFCGSCITLLRKVTPALKIDTP